VAPVLSEHDALAFSPAGFIWDERWWAPWKNGGYFGEFTNR